MNLSLAQISAGAMAAAVSLGSSVQAMGASAGTALQALPTVVAGGMQTLPTALPATVHAGAAQSATLVRDLGLIQQPAKAIAAGIPRATLLVRTAGFLARALPVVTIGASTLSGARIVNAEGPGALVTTKGGRGAVLGAVGGTLLLIPTPATQIAAAGVLGAVAANQFGGLDGLDGARLDPASR